MNVITGYASELEWSSIPKRRFVKNSGSYILKLMVSVAEIFLTPEVKDTFGGTCCVIKFYEIQQVDT